MVATRRRLPAAFRVTTSAVIGRLPIAALSAVDIERVLAKMTARGLATVSRRRALSVMRLILDYGVRDRRITANVARTVATPRGSAKREPHWLTADQLAALATAMPASCAPSVLFLGLAGCRFSEMAALRVADVITTQHGLGVRIHRAAPQSKVTHAAVIGPTKTNQTRTVPVPSAIEDYVRDRIESSWPDDYLFPSPTGVIWTNTNFRKRSKWAETTAAVGLRGTTIHDLRHTAASLLIASGADIKAVQAILGHASGTMTMNLYGHLFSDAPWVAIARLPDLPGFPSSAPADPAGDGTDSANAAGDATAP